MTEEIATQAAEIARLREALAAAQQSLNTIATQGGSEADFMGTMRQVRGYARNRAIVARAALAQEREGSDD